VNSLISRTFAVLDSKGCKMGWDPSLTTIPQGLLSMTICAVVICKHESQDVLLSISDRKIIVGNRQYETKNQTKLYDFGERRNVYATGGGRFDLHTRICERTHQRADKEGIVDVADISRIYREEFLAMKDERQDTVGAGSIIFGIDSGGAQIYSVLPPDGLDECCNPQGYFVIGSGAREFETEFMAAHYDRFQQHHAALFLLYSAKIRAEVDNHVGRTTDVYLFNEKGKWQFKGMSALEAYYDELTKKRTEIIERMVGDSRFDLNPPSSS
jgi:hypothetical protein